MCGRQPRPLGWVKGLMSSASRTEACRGRVFGFCTRRWSSLEARGSALLFGRGGSLPAGHSDTERAPELPRKPGREALRNLWEISRVVQN